MRRSSRHSVPTHVHRLVCHLVSILYRGIHTNAAAPGVGKLDSAMLWVWGRSLIALFSRSRCAAHRTWACAFALFDISFHSYSRHHLLQPFVVYTKLSAKRNQSYGGHTGVGMISREAARLRKFRQRVLTNDEPAITVWRRQGTFFDFVPIVLRICPDKRSAEVGESQLLEARKCVLNKPYVYRLLGRRNCVSHPWREQVVGARTPLARNGAVAFVHSGWLAASF